MDSLSWMFTNTSASFLFKMYHCWMNSSRQHPILGGKPSAPQPNTAPEGRSWELLHHRPWPKGQTPKSSSWLGQSASRICTADLNIHILTITTQRITRLKPTSHQLLPAVFSAETVFLPEAISHLLSTALSAAFWRRSNTICQACDITCARRVCSTGRFVPGSFSPYKVLQFGFLREQRS